MKANASEAFAVWVTGLPASGKSSLAAALKSQLADRGIAVAVLETDVLRRILTPLPRYDDQERELFYRQMTYIGTLLVTHGVSVIFDATANRRSYRNAAHAQIPRLLEVYVDCPLEVCIARDPKKIYQKGREGEFHAVPGLQSVYEPPETPDVLVQSDREMPEAAARRVLAKLEEKGFLQGCVDNSIESPT